jgi:hypothetical protein
MAALHNDVFDNGLSVLNANTEKLYILSSDPGLTWGNIAAATLGVKNSPTVAAPSDRSGGGREVVVSAITDGSVSATGTASHYALTDDSESKILATGSLSATQVVTSGNVFTLGSVTIGIPDPA